MTAGRGSRDSRPEESACCHVWDVVGGSIDVGALGEVVVDTFLGTVYGSRNLAGVSCDNIFYLEPRNLQWKVQASSSTPIKLAELERI